MKLNKRKEKKLPRKLRKEFKKLLLMSNLVLCYLKYKNVTYFLGTYNKKIFPAQYYNLNKDGRFLKINKFIVSLL